MDRAARRSAAAAATSMLPSAARQSDVILDLVPEHHLPFPPSTARRSRRPTRGSTSRSPSPMSPHAARPPLPGGAVALLALVAVVALCAGPACQERVFNIAVGAEEQSFAVSRIV